ncbi:hypothetical protein OUZ56_015496 [Daphnia magna]|uniref:FHA domain-containing protein n=1 Tax=Daphnia magna TaxID=35525 RepID=A0ABR0AN70_9CRUS|nr:hypothetical protein OUZ56_015496 [Daphnia magna]
MTRATSRLSRKKRVGELGDIAIPPRLTQFLAVTQKRRAISGGGRGTSASLPKPIRSSPRIENHITTEENYWSLEWSDYGRSKRGLNLAVLAFSPARWRTFHPPDVPRVLFDSTALTKVHARIRTMHGNGNINAGADFFVVVVGNNHQQIASSRKI